VPLFFYFHKDSASEVLEEDIPENFWEVSESVELRERLLVVLRSSVNSSFLLVFRIHGKKPAYFKMLKTLTYFFFLENKSINQALNYFLSKTTLSETEKKTLVDQFKKV
jgi:hypothetical protein